MVTGIEIAGLVLAIVPLLVEAAKAYSKGIDHIRNVTSNSRRDEKLENFYLEFWWEADFLYRTLQELVDELPLLCLHCKEILKFNSDICQPSISQSMWESDSLVRESLFSHFGGQADLDSFLLVMSRVMDLMDRLIKDNNSTLALARRDPTSIYLRLKEFIVHRKAGTTSSSFIERVRFFREEKNRDNSLENLHRWNKRFSLLSQRIRNKKRVEAISAITPRPMIAEFRSFFSSLLRALQSRWDCNCSDRHQAMLCFKVWPISSRYGNFAELEFELLLPKNTKAGSLSEWIEGTVLVRTLHHPVFNEKAPFPTFCELPSPDNGSSLRFLVDTNGATESIWQLRPQPSRFLQLNKTRPLSLRESLCANDVKVLKDKRLLALTMGYALMQSHGSPFIKDVLEKDSVFLLKSMEMRLDFSRLFVATKFPRLNASPEPLNITLQHRCAPILNLGILLLEVHFERLLETQYEMILTADERANQSPNTKLVVAERLVDRLEPWVSNHYRDAIIACLKIPWVPAGIAVDLSDSDISAGFYDHVVKPLETDVDLYRRPMQII